MKKRLLLLLIFVGVIVILRFAGVGQFLSFAKFKAERVELAQFVTDRYLYAVLVYIAVYLLTVAFSVPVAALLTVAGGFLFGTVLGTLYANIGATIGATVAFLIVRHLIGKAMQKRYGVQLA